MKKLLVMALDDTEVRFQLQQRFTKKEATTAKLCKDTWFQDEKKSPWMDGRSFPSFVGGEDD
jgi:hypothetical protein